MTTVERSTPTPALPRRTGRGSKSRCLALAAVLSLAALTALPAPAASILKDGDVVAIVGDSITEGRQYSSLIEDYLLLCQPAKVRSMQFGWSGETVGGLNSRMADPVALKPTVVTLCYGMNDGRYTAVTDEIKSTFHAGLFKAVQALKQAGARVVVGSPGCVDADTFVRPTVTAAVYNANLAALRDEAAAVARESGSAFADVHSPMFDAMGPAKAKFGKAYPIAGPDGVHPHLNGGLAMAYAFLKGLGFDGDIGTISVDLEGHKAFTSGRHEVTSITDNAMTVVSRAYPFCFGGDPQSQDATRGIIDFVPFNADLNRFTLKAVGTAAKYKVTWGNASKTYTADQLKTGINLAAEFLDNPFVGPFMAVHKKVMDKQGSETLLLKQLLHSVNVTHALLPGHDADLNAVAAAVPEGEKKLADDLAAAIAPVTHTITIEPTE